MGKLILRVIHSNLVRTVLKVVQHTYFSVDQSHESENKKKIGTLTADSRLFW